MTRQVSTLNVLASSQQPKTSRQDKNIALSRLIKLTATMIRKQLLSMIWTYYNTDKPTSHSQQQSHSWLTGQAIYHLDHLVVHTITSWSKHPHDHLVMHKINSGSKNRHYHLLTTSQTEWSFSRSSQPHHHHPAKLLQLTISTYISPISHSFMWVLVERCDLVRTYAHDQGRDYR